MNLPVRLFALAAETAVYGPSFGFLNYLIRSPAPLDPERTWTLVAETRNPVVDWARRSYPPWFLRRFLLAAKIRQDHALGIAAHYDVSNEFYELFLDKLYTTATWCSFPPPGVTSTT